MVSSPAATVDQFLASLPADRRAALTTLRATINANLPPGYEEGMLYGMMGWYIPLSTYSTTYNGQPLGLVGLASQKQYMSIYLMTVYGDPAIESWFKAAYAASGKKLDMGKSCVRFKSIDAVPLDVIGETITKVSVEQYLANYEAVKGSERTRKAARIAAAEAATAKTASAKSAATKSTKPKAKPAPKVTARAKPPIKTKIKAKPTTKTKIKANKAKLAKAKRR